jgi:Ser/Thr protein kinase RdoA (MazF antagonist)
MGGIRLSDMQYRLRIGELCRYLQIGELSREPEALSGGHLHRMYAIHTSQGKFAVKALNPQIMHRPTAVRNFIRSERIAELAAQILPALQARRFEGIFIHELEGQFYLVFDWVVGECLTSDKITATHSRKMGSILADLHRIDFSRLEYPMTSSAEVQPIEWEHYFQRGHRVHAEWVKLMGDMLEELREWNVLANESARLLDANKVIGHRDLEPKNVMWNNEEPLIIDWESAGFVNLMYDLVETAIYWSKNSQGHPDQARFTAFIKAYREKYGTVGADWRIVLSNGFKGRLEWLEYNLKRSLGIECADQQEQQLGTDQSLATVEEIKRYATMIPLLEQWIFSAMEN